MFLINKNTEGYQPVDRTPAEIHRDIAIMKKAGFTMVRMSDLSWDSFEPSEGHFSFEWFDAILDEMHANGIRVVLDISGLPAPVWLHHAYPGVDLISQNGTRLPPAERYMDDISDPDYRRLVVRFADVLTRHYAHHPAIIAVGYDNEGKVWHDRRAERSAGRGISTASTRSTCRWATARARPNGISTCTATGGHSVGFPVNNASAEHKVNTSVSTTC